MESKTYKLRAETIDDVFRFLRRFKQKLWGIKIEQQFLSPAQGQELGEFQQTGIPIPDVTFEFKTKVTLQEIIATLKKVPDSHVMRQTVNPINEYTGNRIYEM